MPLTRIPAQGGNDDPRKAVVFLQNKEKKGIIFWFMTI